jgi:23S rRNA pseudouridine2457 synthase
MVSQFVSPDNVRLLGSIDFEFPAGTHAVGRLDSHSEGLLLLTTNKKVTKLLFESVTPHKRTYLVLVNDVVHADTLTQLQTGICIRIAGGIQYVTPPCDVAIVTKPELLYSHIDTTPVKYPHTWLTITLTEGKYHQVRKMVFAAHHRCRRLIRIAIEDIHLGNMLPGSVYEVAEKDFFEQLHINYPF